MEKEIARIAEQLEAIAKEKKRTNDLLFSVAKTYHTDNYDNEEFYISFCSLAGIKLGSI